MSSIPARLGGLAVPFAALALLAVPVSPASAAKRELRPASVGKHTMTFTLTGLKPQAIVKATLYRSHKKRKLARSTVRRAARSGSLRVRRSPARRAKLVIVTDTTAPRVRWRELRQGTRVSGVLSSRCRVRASDNVKVRHVDFYLNGKRIRHDSAAPFACRWDTRTAMNGRHNLSAVAVDGAGHATTTSVGVIVHRSGPGATTPPASPSDPRVPPSPSDPPPPPSNEPSPFENLVFEENFDGTSVNAAQWGAYNSPGHAGNGLRRASAFSVANGQLAVTANWDGTNIVSGGMNHKSNYKYGRFEFRVRTENDPTGQTSGVVLTWPQSNHWIPDGETDIYETAHGRTRNPFYSYIHYNTDGKTDKSYSHTHQADGTQWHTMRMDWTAEYIKLYRDGVQVYTLRDAQAIRDVPHHLSIQLDAFSNRPLQGPVRMFVDWVKVYQ